MSLPKRDPWESFTSPNPGNTGENALRPRAGNPFDDLRASHLDRKLADSIRHLIEAGTLSVTSLDGDWVPIGYDLADLFAEPGHVLVPRGPQPTQEWVDEMLHWDDDYARRLIAHTFDTDRL